MSDSLFQVTGISSGISWDEIISKTLAAAQKPAEQWQSKIDTLEYKKSLYEEFSSSLFKLRNSLTTLRIPSMFKSKTAEFNVRNAGQSIPLPDGNITYKASNASDIVKATVTADAEIAQWKIDVKQTAAKQQVYSDRQSDLTMPLGLTGTFKIRVGAQVTEIKVTASDTLRTINQSIALAKDQNGDRIDVTAQLIDNRLVIESASSGTGNTGEKGSETLAYSLSDGNTTFLPKAATGTTYPPSILSLTVKGVPYVEGSANDFTYDSSTGKITWMTGHVPTEDGAVIEVEYASSFELSGSSTTITALPTGVAYDPNTIKFDLYDKMSGTKYTEDFHYTIKTTPPPASASTTTPEILWVSANVPTPPTDTVVYVRQGSYTVPGDPSSFVENNYSTNRNEFILEYVSGDDVLQSLGLVDSSGTMLNMTAAQDAELTVNGIAVTRSDNVIEDLIAGVKLELVGLGDVTMNIVQDTEKAVKAVQAFIDAYNEVMTWINDKLEEKYSSTAAVDDDYLQNLLSSTDKSTVFGVLHGDQLLSSIKNQLRNMVSNSVVNTSLALATKKYLHTDTDLKLEGEFYVYAGGQALRIDVKGTDSLEDIRDKILSYFSVTSKDGTKPTSDDLKLNAFIRDGQLVVEYNSASTLTSPRVEYIARNNARLDGGTGGDYDILPFTATTEPPISGKFTVQVGEATTDGMGNTVPPKYYYEGVDFEIENVWTTNSAATPPVSMLESRIKWISADKPSDDATYKLTYEYNPTGVAYSVISTSSDDEKNLKKLELHTDTSKSQLSSFGIKTTLVDDEFGKRGLLEFNSDTLIAALAADDNTTSSVMTGFFRSLDTYIGNLVDSSNVIVGGTSVTKGRVAAAMLTIDNEVNTLTAQISKLEKQLADRQTAMYKQYSDMEMAIQKLNAQMSSISQYLTNTSSS